MLTVLCVPDGAADAEPTGAHPTCLEEAATPTWDRLATEGVVLAVRTIPAGLPAGTEVGLTGLLGVRVDQPPARGRIDAAAAGCALSAGEAAWRLDAWPPALLSSDAVAAVDAAVAPLGGRIAPLGGHRLLLVGPAAWGDAPPGPHQTGAPLTEVATAAFADVAWAATAALRDAGVPAQAWPWGRAGADGELPSLPARHGGPVVVLTGGGAAPGLARLVGADVLGDDPADAARAATDADDGTLLVVHDPRPDDAGHARDRAAKVAALARFDADILGPLVAALSARGDAALIVGPDHGCDPATGRHTAPLVPAVVWACDRRPRRTACIPPTERAVAGQRAIAAHRLLGDVQRARRPEAAHTAAAQEVG